ncbi:MAG: hypothetical protein LBJ36_05800 [Synergistaceae bacterium]|jgi:hypothetical protein|nr:hypothetical protein [Synergistaceae bacterium]
MRTYIFKLYKAKRNKHLHHKISLAGSIYNHLIALHRRYYRLFGKSLNVIRYPCYPFATAYNQTEENETEENETLRTLE